MSELKAGFDNLEELSKALNLKPETVGDLLLYTSGTEISEDLTLPDDVMKIFNKSDTGETLTDEETEKIHNAVVYSGAFAIEKYFQRVHDHPDKYIDTLRNAIDNFKEDQHDGETLEECIKRQLKSETLTFEVSTQQERQAEIFTQPYIKLLNSELTDIIFSLSLRDFEPHKLSNTATYSKDGVEIKVKDYNSVKNLTPSQLKLWDAAVAYLTNNNPYPTDGKPIKAASIQKTIEIPLVDYAQVRGWDVVPRIMSTPEEQGQEQARIDDNISQFRKAIRKDLDVLQKISISGSVEKGTSAGRYQDVPFILNNPRIDGNDNIVISFDDKMAELLVNSHIMQYSPKLQSLQGHNTNNIRIGRYMNLHSSMSRNRNKKSQFTLSVNSLISNSSIYDLKTLQEKGIERNWRDKSKKKLEDVLKNLVDCGFLARWDYRNPKTQEILTPNQARYLTPAEYFNLRVDYILTDDLPEVPKIRQKNEVGADG